MPGSPGWLHNLWDQWIIQEVNLLSPSLLQKGYSNRPPPCTGIRVDERYFLMSLNESPNTPLHCRPGTGMATTLLHPKRLQGTCPNLTLLASTSKPPLEAPGKAYSGPPPPSPWRAESGGNYQARRTKERVADSWGPSWWLQSIKPKDKGLLSRAPCDFTGCMPIKPAFRVVNEQDWRIGTWEARRKKQKPVKEGKSEKT